MKDIRARLERMGLGGGDGRFLAASIAVCLTALLAYGALVHLPLRAEQAAYEKKAVELRTRLAAVMNFKNVHGDLAAYEKELSDREGRTERVLPRELGQGDFLQDLQHKALQSQVKLQKVAPAEVRLVDGVQEMPVSIACSGSYFSPRLLRQNRDRVGNSPSTRRASSSRCRARTARCSVSSSSRPTPGRRMRRRAGRTTRQRKRRLLLLNEDRYPLK